MTAPILLRTASTLVLLTLSALPATLVGCGNGGGGGGNTQPACTAGAKGCACKPGNACDDGLTCTGNVCGEGVSSGVVVSSPNARGCDVLLEEKGVRVEKVAYDSTVKGTFIRQAPRVALSFVSASDAPIPNGAIKLTLSGPSAQVAVAKVTCVDSKAAPIADATIKLP